jgi:hypothetical protein
MCGTIFTISLDKPLVSTYYHSRETEAMQTQQMRQMVYTAQKVTAILLRRSSKFGCPGAAEEAS